MKNVFTSLMVFATLAVPRADADIVDDDIAVARYLAEKIVRVPERTDCFSGTESGTVPMTFPTYESLFEVNIPEGYIGHGWTDIEKKNAFERFLADVPRLSQTNSVRDLRFVVETALGFCRDRDASNVLDFAEGILASSCNVGVADAVAIFKAKAIPSIRVNGFVETAITNRFSTYYSEVLARDYAVKLRSMHESINGAVITNGTQMLVRVGCCGSAARQLDKLLAVVYPEYCDSSNRLALAIRALEDLSDRRTFFDKTLLPYFETITNRLLNAAQSLPEVEALRGL